MAASSASDRDRLATAAEVARELGLTAQGVRFYEEQGLITPARVGKTRVYTYRDRARLRLIQKLRRVGFSLAAIRDYLGLYRADASGAAQYRAGLARIRDRIRELEGKRRAIEDALGGLQVLERDASERLAAAEPGAAGGTADGPRPGFVFVATGPRPSEGAAISLHPEDGHQG